MPPLQIVDLLPEGPLHFEDVVSLQRAAEARVKAGGAEALFLLEHRDVVTAGRNAALSDLRVTAAALERLGVEFARTDRGGRLTFHGPGQLVAYPVLDLSRGMADVRRYVRALEEVLILTAASFGVAARRSDLPGRWSSVWVGNDKLAAIGVHISRWVTTHGAAMNVSTDLSRFDLIVPCGIRDGGVTSLERLLAKAAAPSLAEVGRAFVRHFSDVLARPSVSTVSRDAFSDTPPDPAAGR